MPRGRDRRNDPDNDLTREGIERRLAALPHGSYEDEARAITGDDDEGIQDRVAALSDEDFITQYGMIGPGGKIRTPPWSRPVSNYTEPEEEGKYFSHPDPEQERIERKQEQYREEGPDWGI